MEESKPEAEKTATSVTKPRKSNKMIFIVVIATLLMCCICAGVATSIYVYSTANDDEDTQDEDDEDDDDDDDEDEDDDDDTPIDKTDDTPIDGPDDKPYDNPYDSDVDDDEPADELLGMSTLYLTYPYDIRFSYPEQYGDVDMDVDSDSCPKDTVKLTFENGDSTNKNWMIFNGCGFGGGGYTQVRTLSSMTKDGRVVTISVNEYESAVPYYLVQGHSSDSVVDFFFEFPKTTIDEDLEGLKSMVETLEFEE